MNDNLQDLAISQALKGQWQEAVITNKKILQETPDDVDALNRLARAYFECGDTTNAKKSVVKVLKIDHGNSIASKALSKYEMIKDNKSLKENKHGNIKTSDFIEEAGTTKHTDLLNICSKDLLSTLSPGDELMLTTHSHKVSVVNQNNKYVGKVPDDLSAKLRKLTKNGYKFKVVVKSVDEKCIKIIIRETNRGKGYESVKPFINDNLES